MTKKEFVELYLKKSGLKSKIEAERTLNAFLESIQEALELGEDVSFSGFGKFETVEREAREGRHPASGEKIKIPAKRIVKFRVGKHLSAAVEK